MGFVARQDFSLGWTPNADAVNAPATAALRADNLILDELGVIALRPGSAKINATPFGDLDVHSLYTTMIEGTRYRLVGASNAVYANGSAIATGFPGSDDISFGFQLGQILFARSTMKRKYDGTTVRNWGIAMTGKAPAAVPIPPDHRIIALCSQAEQPPFTVVESGSFGGVQYTAGPVPLCGTCALLLGSFSSTTQKQILQKTWSLPQDLATYENGQAGVDSDTVSYYFFASDLNLLSRFCIQVDVNEGTFLNDWYQSPIIDNSSPINPNGTPSATNPGEPGQTLSGLQWMKVTCKRGDFVRIGSTTGTGWNTARAVRIFAERKTGVTLVLKVAMILLTGGAQRTLKGPATWRYVYVRNASGYQALSAPSTASQSVLFDTQAATVTIPVDPHRDPQVNEVWLYRLDDGVDGTYYRTAVKAIDPGYTGPVLIDDLTSSSDALLINVPLVPDIVGPPDNIIAIVGTHFDRMLALTRDGLLWPSRKLDPDAFSTGQAIRVGSSDEEPLWMLQALTEVFIGTSKDIYRLEGTGAELPDGSVDYTLRPLSIDHRPVNGGLAHEGTQIVFFSDDGWRATESLGTTLLTGPTSLLYRGQTRHGVSPVNVATGRVRAVLGKGQLMAITPEGAATARSNVLYRYVFATHRWYRHVYPGVPGWRSIHREPDGTVIAGDTAGYVWVLDTGTLDEGQPIPVVWWSKADDFGLPYQRKKAGDLRWRIDTGGATATIQALRDGSPSLIADTFTAASIGMDVAAFDLTPIQIFKQLQFRLTGLFPAFHLYDYGIEFRERPVPIIGRVVETLGGSPGVKVISGFVIKGNTLGVERAVTPILNGVADAEVFRLTTGIEEPETHTLRFTGYARRASDIALEVNGEMEIDTWAPIVTQRQPLGVLVWDSGPIDLGDKELVWLREMYLKVRAGANLDITPYFDGVAFPTVTGHVTPDVDSVVRVPVGRAYVGRQPRLVVRSCAPFYPYWVRAVRRVTGSASQKGAVTVPFTLETGGAG